MVTTRPITVDEFEAMPLEGPWELVDGELVEVTPSAHESSTTGMQIGRLLGNHVVPNRLGSVSGADGGFALFANRETVLVPDVAFVSAEAEAFPTSCARPRRGGALAFGPDE